MRINFRTLILLFSITGLFACVSTKKYKDLEKRCNNQRSELRRQNEDLTFKNNEQNAELDKLNQAIADLKSDTTSINENKRKLQADYQQLNQQYKDLQDENKKLSVGSKAEIQKLLGDLNKTQENLLQREDQLKKTERELAEKKINLDKLGKDLNEKEVRLADLQNILNRQDSIVKSLKKTVSDALLGFEGKGLTVQMKNGKVYVSMDEKLLFASGKYEVSKQGVDALKKLSKVLENNADISVLIEGHTDNVPYTGAGQIRDNWDLSVMRATAVLKILVNNGSISPRRLSASGRGEYFPVDNANTSEARAKNRRTEIILTPKLDELFKIIETN